MFYILILMFIFIPLIELGILIEISKYIGLIPTILLVGLTGLIGVSLAKSQGFKIITRVKNNLNRGVLPTDDLIGGLLLLIGGVLLLTPGLLTDITGFSFILPFSRKFLAAFIKQKFKDYIKKGNINFQGFYRHNTDHTREEDYIDIEAEDDDTI